MKPLLILLFYALCLDLSAQSPNLNWAFSLGQSNSTTQARNIVTDANGNVYATGKFYLTVDFDPDTSTFNMTSAGGRDIYIIKLTAQGELIWAKQIGGTDDEHVSSLSIASDGNLLLSGFFDDVCDFDPSSNTYNLTPSGITDAFCCKLDTDGDLVWVKSFGGSSATNAYGANSDPDGNVIVTGAFFATSDFDPGTGTFNMTSAGSRDIFVVKLDSLGDFIWARRAGAGGADVINASAVDVNGNVSATGNFVGTVDFDPGSGTFNLNGGSTKIFTFSWDENANFIWAVDYGGATPVTGAAIAHDQHGNVYTTGQFRGTVDFDPDTSTFNLQSAGTLASDAFVNALDTAGHLIWAKSFRGSSNASDKGQGIALDSDGNVYTTGYFLDVVDFDPGPDTFLLSVSQYNQTGIYISKLDSLGDFVWAASMGNDGGNQGISIAVDDAQNVYSTGAFEDTVDFDPGSGVYELVAQANNDAYIQKLGVCNLTSINFDTAVCDSFISPNNEIYYSSGQYVDTVNSSSGCDTAFSINLTIHNSSETTVIQQACDSYFWPVTGSTYTSTGLQSASFTSSEGCDSTIVLDLTIKNSVATSESVHACEAYTWLANNTTYSLSGSYSAVFTAANGCDSTSTLNLTIPEINTAVYQIAINTIEATQTNASYQWLDCDSNMMPLAGETSQWFLPEHQRAYAVAISLNACADTSECMAYNTIGFSEDPMAVPLEIYPNPANDFVHFNQPISGELINSQGQVNARFESKSSIDLSEIAPGIYYLNSSYSSVQKLMIVKN